MRQTLRFPSPLIEPDVRISRIRLSDRPHRQPHGARSTARGISAIARGAFAARQSSFGWLLRLAVLSGPRPITSPSPSSRARRKSGSFPPPALPGFTGTTALSDSRPAAAQSRRRGRYPRCDGSPPITRNIFPTCRAQYPGGLTDTTLSRRHLLTGASVTAAAGLVGKALPADAKAPLRPTALLAQSSETSTINNVGRFTN